LGGPESRSGGNAEEIKLVPLHGFKPHIVHPVAYSLR
jgi:hypothetical protein